MKKGKNGMIRHSHWGDVVFQFTRNRLAVASFIILCIIVFASLFANIVAPYGIDEQQISEALQPPSMK